MCQLAAKLRHSNPRIITLHAKEQDAFPRFPWHDAVFPVTTPTASGHRWTVELEAIHRRAAIIVPDTTVEGWVPPDIETPTDGDSSSS